MNSLELKGNFLDTYKYFFNKYDLVISSPVQFPLIGDTSLFSEGNGSLVTQKIPLRNYIGVNFNESSSKNVEFIYKNNMDSIFKTGTIENFYPMNKDLLTKIGFSGEIGFLSEYNWNDPPSIISNILVALLLLSEKIEIEDLNNLDINNPLKNDILEKILGLDKTLLNDHNFFGQSRNNSNFIGSCLLKSRSHILTIEHDGKVDYVNIGENSNFSTLDLGVYIINPNSVVKTNYKTKLMKEQLSHLNGFIDNKGIKGHEVDILGGIEKISYFYSLKTFKNLSNLYEHSDIEFFNDIFCYRNILKHFFKNYSTGILDIMAIKDNVLDHIGNRNINLYIDQIGACQDARIIIFSDKSLYIDELLLESLNEKLGQNFTLDYSSFSDGFEIGGTRIEQFKSKKIFGEFSSGNMLTQFNRDRSVHSTIDYNEAIKDKQNDVLLDLIEKKIYINGEKITSNELLSQSTTIELLAILIEKTGEDISNKILSSSSYSKNKNEMLGKIVTPLVRLIKNKLGKDLPLVCKGSLNEFYLNLNTSDVVISILKKI